MPSTGLGPALGCTTVFATSWMMPARDGTASALNGPCPPGESQTALVLAQEVETARAGAGSDPRWHERLWQAFADRERVLLAERVTA